MTRTQEIRNFIIHNVFGHPKDITRVAADEFQTSRQFIARQIAALVREGVLTAAGRTRGRSYSLAIIWSVYIDLKVTPDLEEDVVWRQEFQSGLSDLPENVLAICRYGFTEILNNVVDHSEATAGHISVVRTALGVSILVRDMGVGIFNKIQREFGLHDPRHALLELSKGKLTSDEAAHTGEGIFFVSRVFDSFRILSGTLFYSRVNAGDDWLIETSDHDPLQGTQVAMDISTDSLRTTQEVFNEYAGGEGDYAFTRTHVPIQLARYEGDQLVSRSAAKRLLTRFDRFREVFLDFRGVEEIGPAFADEIFRVFQREHPDISIVVTYTTPQIDLMIERAKEAAARG